MNKPLVSIVMTVYNGEKFLSESIESILNQSYKNFEFIIFEDGSLDNSYSILKNYSEKDKRIILIKNKKNNGFAGYVKNLNTGINLSRGKYIARMDADDISLPNRLEKQVNFLEKNKDIFLVGSGRFFIDENNNYLGIRFGIIGFNRIKSILSFNNCIVHPSIMFRNEKVSYRENMRYCEDYDFYLNLLSKNKKLDNLFEPLIKYRLVSNSISRSKSVMQQLLSNKAIEFFNERKIKGFDSYKKFNPDLIIKKIDKVQINSYENIKFNFVASNYTSCLDLSKKYLKKNGFFNFVFFFYIFSKYVFLAHFLKQMIHFFKLFKFFVFY